jgi:oligoendopeptidase F
MGDAFQHWIYTHPEHSPSRRRAAWMELRHRFSDGTDWKGYQKYEEALWQKQMHLFGIPFYYIEYGIAQLGALMVWNQSMNHPQTALARYKKALSLGGSVGLRELFKSIGGRLDLSAKTMRPLIDRVVEKINSKY